jgi:hypothetical protein
MMSKQSYSIRLSHDIKKAIEEMGEGSLVAGIRRAVYIWVKLQQMDPDTPLEVALRVADPNIKE